MPRRRKRPHYSNLPMGILLTYIREDPSEAWKKLTIEDRLGELNAWLSSNKSEYSLSIEQDIERAGVVQFLLGDAVDEVGSIHVGASGPKTDAHMEKRPAGVDEREWFTEGLKAEFGRLWTEGPFRTVVSLSNFHETNDTAEEAATWETWAEEVTEGFKDFIAKVSLERRLEEAEFRLERSREVLDIIREKRDVLVTRKDGLGLLIDILEQSGDDFDTELHFEVVDKSTIAMVYPRWALTQMIDRVRMTGKDPTFERVVFAFGQIALEERAAMDQVLTAPTHNDALDTQLSLLRFWGGSVGYSYAAYYFADIYERMMEAGESEIALDMAKMTADSFTRKEEQRLNVATTYLVSQDMADLAAVASRSLPDHKIGYDDLPATSGFVVIEGNLVGLSAGQAQSAVRAISWGPSTVIDNPGVERRYGGQTEAPSIGVVLYADPQDKRHTDPQFEVTKASLAAKGIKLMREQMMHITDLPLSQSLYEWDDDVQEAYEAAMEERGLPLDRGDARTPVNLFRWLAAFWKLVQQEIPVVHKEYARRNLMRQAQRISQAPEMGTVQVITLRKARPPRITDPDHVPTEVFYSHRWWVEGHWHNYWTRQGLEPRWVDGYVKGPEHLRFVARDRVYEWRR